MLKADSWKRLRRTALGLSAALLLGTLPLVPSAQAASSNGTLLVCTQEGGDVAAARQSLTDAGCSVLSEIPCVEGNFTIFQVQPNNGNVGAAVAKFNGTIDANILSAEATFQSKAQHFGRWWNWPPRRNCTPNDPDYPGQYALSAMSWNDARCFLRLLGISQRAYPRVTVIDTGTNLVPQGDEVTLVQQFNFVGGANGCPEAPFDSGVHGMGVASIMCCKTNNETFIAGASSHNLPVKVTSCRVSNDGEIIDTLDVLRAMTWCVDHQRQRGGPGPINLSLNSSIPPFYNGSPVVQAIAKAARRQGDLFVNASGNVGMVDPSPELNLRRVAATDEDNNLATFSNTGPFKAAAPGVNVALVTGYPAGTFQGTGTSFAAPNWAAGVAFLQSFVPWSNAVRMDRLLFNSTDCTSQGWRIPNYNRAVRSVIYFGWF